MAHPVDPGVEEVRHVKYSTFRLPYFIALGGHRLSSSGQFYLFRLAVLFIFIMPLDPADDPPQHQGSEEHQDQDVRLSEPYLYRPPLGAQSIVDIGQGKAPDRRADRRKGDELLEIDPSNSGRDGDESAYDGDQPGYKNHRHAILFEPPLGGIQMAFVEQNVPSITANERTTPFHSSPVCQCRSENTTGGLCQETNIQSIFPS